MPSEHKMPTWSPTLNQPKLVSGKDPEKFKVVGLEVTILHTESRLVYKDMGNSPKCPI